MKILVILISTFITSIITTAPTFSQLSTLSRVSETFSAIPTKSIHLFVFANPTHPLTLGFQSILLSANPCVLFTDSYAVAVSDGIVVLEVGGDSKAWSRIGQNILQYNICLNALLNTYTDTVLRFVISSDSKEMPVVADVFQMLFNLGSQFLWNEVGRSMHSQAVLESIKSLRNMNYITVTAEHVVDSKYLLKHEYLLHLVMVEFTTVALTTQTAPWVTKLIQFAISKHSDDLLKTLISGYLTRLDVLIAYLVTTCIQVDDDQSSIWLLNAIQTDDEFKKYFKDLTSILINYLSKINAPDKYYSFLALNEKNTEDITNYILLIAKTGNTKALSASLKTLDPHSKANNFDFSRIWDATHSLAPITPTYAHVIPPRSPTDVNAADIHSPLHLIYPTLSSLAGLLDTPIDTQMGYLLTHHLEMSFLFRIEGGYVDSFIKKTFQRLIEEGPLKTEKDVLFWEYRKRFMEMIESDGILEHDFLLELTWLKGKIMHSGIVTPTFPDMSDTEFEDVLEDLMRS